MDMLWARQSFQNQLLFLLLDTSRTLRSKHDEPTTTLLAPCDSYSGSEWTTLVTHVSLRGKGKWMRLVLSALQVSDEQAYLTAAI